MKKAEPLAYFTTFRTYASWLHGDERTSVDRAHRVLGTPRLQPNPNLRKHMQSLSQYESIQLTKGQGDIILEAALHACN